MSWILLQILYQKVYVFCLFFLWICALFFVRHSSCFEMRLAYNGIWTVLLFEFLWPNSSFCLEICQPKTKQKSQDIISMAFLNISKSIPTYKSCIIWSNIDEVKMLENFNRIQYTNKRTQKGNMQTMSYNVHGRMS